MGYQYDDEDEDDFYGADGRGEEPQAPDELRKAYKALKRKFTKLESEHTELKVEKTKAALSEVLKDRSLRPGLARHMLRDEVDPTDKKAIDEWLEDNAEDFGIDLNGSSTEDDAPNEQRASNFARMQNAQANALPADTKMAELNRRMDAAVTPEEINAILAEAGPLING